MVRNYNNQN